MDLESSQTELKVAECVDRVGKLYGSFKGFWELFYFIFAKIGFGDF